MKHSYSDCFDLLQIILGQDTECHLIGVEKNPTHSRSLLQEMRERERGETSEREKQCRERGVDYSRGQLM